MSAMSTIAATNAAKTPATVNLITPTDAHARRRIMTIVVIVTPVHSAVRRYAMMTGATACSPPSQAVARLG